jgi:hypothetical protein
MAEYASGRYDRALDEAEMRAYANIISDIIARAAGQSGGSWRRIQRGGAGEFKAACFQIYQNIMNESSGALSAADRAAARAVMAGFGDLRRTLGTAGFAMAASSICFGTKNAPWVYTALYNSMISAPNLLWTLSSNFISASINAAALTAFGATGVAGLVVFASAIIGLKKLNGFFLGRFLNIASYGKQIVSTILGTTNETIVDEAVAEAVAHPPVITYSVGETTFVNAAIAFETALGNVANIRVNQDGRSRPATMDDFPGVAGTAAGAAAGNASGAAAGTAAGADSRRRKMRRYRKRTLKRYRRA